MKITNLDAVTKKVKEQLARKDSWIQDLNLRGSIVADGQLMENGLRPFKIPGWQFNTTNLAVIIQDKISQELQSSHAALLKSAKTVEVHITRVGFTETGGTDPEDLQKQSTP